MRDSKQKLRTDCKTQDVIADDRKMRKQYGILCSIDLTVMEPDLYDRPLLSVLSYR